MAKQIAFYFDASACTACRTCQMACKDKKDNPNQVYLRHIFNYSGGGWLPHPKHKDLMHPSNIFSYSISVACYHCQKPICVEVCPTGAMYKRDDGIVLIENSKCIGCRLCELSCPYGAPQFNSQLGIETKCDLCVDLLEQGKGPACVESCPMRALAIGELSELEKRHGKLNAIEPLPEAHFTKPALVITPHQHSQQSGKGNGRIEKEL